MPDPISSTSDSELRAHVENVLRPQYELDREIGRGGMGIVYRARDARLKRTVAVKLLPPELAFRGEIRSRFLREAETAAQLSHSNIVPIYTVGEAGNLVFFVMAMVEGDNLAKRLHDRGRLDPVEARRILREVADALAFAHERGVIHRDIKPDNILLDQHSGRAMVTDFGIARAVESSDSRLTATGMAIGTPAYMSPEQCAGEREIDGRSDLYSLGVVAYQMLTGDLPFTAANTPAMLVKHLSEPPPPIHERRPDLPDDLSRAVMLLLEKEPDDRFPDAAALVAALDGARIPERARARVPTAHRPQPAATRPAPTDEPGGVSEPTAQELQRWSAPEVERYRKKVAPYVAVNSVIVVGAILTGTNFMFVTMIWTIIMAYGYAKLWTDGYDWRDVFKQTRDRQLVDVATETIGEVQGLFDKEKRKTLQAKVKRQRKALPRGEAAGAAASAGSAELEAELGERAAVVRQAASDRDMIVQIVAGLPREQRDLVVEVPTSAQALYDRIRALALTLAELDRDGAGDTRDAIAREIAALEAEANPLDREGSEARVRRLAMLRRKRRQMQQSSSRHEEATARLESCTLALRNMRFDVLRLRAGTQTADQLTSLAIQAQQLAREVDHAVYAAEQVGRLTASAPGGRRTREHG